MTTQTQKQSAHHLVVSLNVTGGFLAGAQLEFADGLNCLIGGRGAGKTTALEFLRFGLGLMPDQRANPQRHRAIDTLVKANLGNGRLRIEIRTKTDMRYTAGRSAHETVQVLNEIGTAVPISLDRDQIFGADVFSQNEIEEIASSPAAQLELLDRFQEHETATIDRELEQLQRQLDQSSTDLRRIDQEVDDARVRGSELPVLQEKLKGLAEVAGPDANRINVAHAAKSHRAREEKVPDLIIATLQNLVREIGSSESAFQAGVGAQFDVQIRQGANRELFQALQTDVDVFARHLAETVRSIESEARSVEERIRTHSAVLAERHAIQEAEYRTIIAASEEQGERSTERLVLQTTLANAQSAANEQLAKEQQRQGMIQARGELLNRSTFRPKKKDRRASFKSIPEYSCHRDAGGRFGRV
jgi:AAA domain-containing protein